MCKIFLVINKSKNFKTVRDLVDANINSLSSEQDGYSVFRDNKTFFYDGENAYLNIGENLKYKKEEIYIVHTRTKTTGSSGLDGLHLQEIDGFVFAHNGTVEKFSCVEKKSDSYYFFKHFLKKYKGNVNIKNLNEHCQETGFWGRGVLYHKKTKDLFFFCNATAYINILKDAIILSSYPIEKEKKEHKTRSVLGYSWIEKVKKIPIKGIMHSSEINNICLHFKNGILIDQGLIENKNVGWLYQKQFYNFYKDNDNRNCFQLD